MQLARVIGRATASIKHPSLHGCKMMIVQALDAQGAFEEADPLMAIDLVGAGMGDTVMMTSDGPTARDAVGNATAPIRWSIVGVRDA